MRSLIGVLGVLLRLVGLVPLIWLFVVFRVSRWPLPFRLQFWQTQSIGLAFAVCCVALIVDAWRRG